MSGCVKAWVCVCILSGLLLAAAAAAAAECSEEETLLKPIASGVLQPSDCLMECTATTYIKRLQLRDDRNIRLKDSREGEGGEFCWSGHLRCTVGESFHSAFVVLPLDGTAAGPERVEVRAPDGPSDTLHTHGGPTTIGDGCGLRYDVTQHVGSQAAGTSFCVRVAAPEDAQADGMLRCPPYLVTFWMRKQANRQDGG